MQNQGRVSIILPIYNAEEYLEECVNSVLNQTYPNLQIILVNDGSKDNSWKICQKLKDKDSRIEIYSQKNSGVSVARNKGLEVANGKWIMFVDPDDILDKNIVNFFLSKLNNKVDIIACSCYGFDDKQKFQAHFFSGNRKFDLQKEDLYLQLLNVNYGQTAKVFTAIGVPWGKIYRRSFIESNNLKFDPKLRRMQDNIFNLYAFSLARNVYYFDLPLYYYRLNNITSFNDRHLKDLEKIFLPVVIARYKALKELKLLDNTEIYKSYVIESTNMFMEIVRSSLLTKIGLRKSEKHIHSLMQKPYFKMIFSDDGKKIIKDKKLRVKLFLIKHNMYRIYLTIYKLKNKLK